MPEAPNESERIDREKAVVEAYAGKENRDVAELLKGNEDLEGAEMYREHAEAQEIIAGIVHEMEHSGGLPLPALKEIEAAVKAVREKYSEFDETSGQYRTKE